MFKNALFQLHWIIGITVGTVLAIVGLTGGILSFEDEILRTLNPGVLTVEVPAGVEKLTPQQLIEALKTGQPDARVMSVAMSNEADTSSIVTIAPPKSPTQGRGEGSGRGRQLYLDPYTGTQLGEPAGRPFFQTVEQVHRWLVLPGGNNGVGKQIVGISTLLLVFMAISGIYLRWPTRFLNWRAWFKLSFRHRGRALWWNLHSVLGVYVFFAYLIMALTGIWWTFDWYKNGLSLALTGKPATQQGPGGPPGGGPTPDAMPEISLAATWNAFTGSTGGSWETANIQLPRKAGDPVQIRFLAAGAAHERAFDTMKIDPATGTVASWDKFAAKTSGEQLYGSIFPLHSGSYFGVAGTVLWMLASLLMPVFFVTGWLLYLGRRKQKRVMRTREAAARAAPAE